MKTPFKLLASAGAAALLLASPGLQAESQYGYSPTGATGVTANASVNISVAVPTLILLRVGAATGVSTLEFKRTPDVTTTPDSTTLGALTGNASDAAANWSGDPPAAPTFAAPAGQALTAFVWTNSAGGGSLALSSDVTAPLSGLSPAAITVATTAGTAGMPAHPANTTTGNFTGTVTRNALQSATWTYSVDATALASALPGVYTQTTTYTATAL